MVDKDGDEDEEENEDVWGGDAMGPLPLSIVFFIVCVRLRLSHPIDLWRLRYIMRDRWRVVERSRALTRVPDACMHHTLRPIV
jgi:hypothetical protein